MDSHAQSICRLLYLYLATLFLGVPIVRAQELGSDLNGLAKHVGKEITKANFGSVAIWDFVTQDGEESPQGHYLAQEFSQSLRRHQKGLRVVEPTEVLSLLTSAKISAKQLSDTDALQQIGNSLHVEALVTGIVKLLLSDIPYE